MARNFTGRKDFLIPESDVPVAQVVRVEPVRDLTTVPAVVQRSIRSIERGS